MNEDSYNQRDSGQAITRKDLEPLTAINPADVRLAAMNLLARREHSLRELRQKLSRRFDDEAIVEEQLLRLVADGLQSDERFARSFVRQRLMRYHGPNRIRQEMRQRGLSDRAITEAIEAEEPDWGALAEEAMQRKFGSKPAADIREKAKRNRFMQYRGFPAEYYQWLIR